MNKAQIEEMEKELEALKAKNAELVDERNSEHNAYLLAVSAKDMAKANLEAVQKSEEFQTVKFISQFSGNDDGLSTSLVDGVTTYTITAKGKEYTLANGDEARLALRSINVAKVEQGATIAKYASLDAIDRAKAYTGFSCKNIGEYAEKVLGIAKGSANDYLSTLRTFFTYDEKQDEYLPIHPFVRGASLTNLKQAKGLYNKDNAKFWQYCVNGELHLSGNFNDLKKELKLIDKEIPSVTANTDEPKQDEPKQDEADTPKDRARFYLSKARADMLEAVQDESAKMEVCKMLDELLKYLI